MNGEAALAACEQRDYDVILMDVQMPVMDGLEATRRLRARATKHRPFIVALTASAMDGDQALCVASGMDMYLSKPIDLQRLQHALIQCKAEQRNTATDDLPMSPVGHCVQRRNSRVLVVDDNRLNVMVLQQLLRRQGIACDVAGDGAEAVNLLEAAHLIESSPKVGEEVASKYVMVFMDLHMPRMDGLEATRRLRTLELEHGWQRIPVVAVTASVTAETRADCFAVGMNDFIPKPVSAQQLVQILAHYSLVHSRAVCKTGGDDVVE
jgi:CheY-like chemotaxis protein